MAGDVAQMGQAAPRRRPRPVTVTDLPKRLVAARIVAAILGSYVAMVGLTILATVLAGLIDLSLRWDVFTTSAMIGETLYVVFCIGAFAVRSLGRVWLILFGGGGGALLAAYVLSGFLPAAASVG